MPLAMIVSLLTLGAPQPELFVLAADANVWDVAVIDVNGDSHQDLVAFCSDEKSAQPDKHLAIYLGEDGLYGKAPSFILPLDAGVGSAFFSEIDGREPKELVTIARAGATTYRFREEAFEKFGESEFASLLPVGSREPMFLPEAAEDLDGDGIDEWIIPVSEGYEIRNAQGLRAKVRSDVRSEMRDIGTTIITHRLPTMRSFQLPDSQTKGLAFLSDEFADFWFGPHWTEHVRHRIPLKLEQKWESFARMEDVDGNGFPDIIVTQTQGTINMQVLTQVYVAQALFEYSDEPTARFETKGGATSPFLTDVNGDEKLDLVLISVPINLRNIASFFFRGKVRANVEVYYFQDGGYPDEPSREAFMTMDAPDGREQIAYAMGDYNGDGRVDVAMGSGEDTLALHLGATEAFISRRPWIALEMPTFGVAEAYRLDGDGTDDIVMYHPAGDNGTRIDVIVF